MNIWLTDTAFNKQKIIENYISMLWTDRFYETGEFELIVPASKETLKEYQQDLYIYNSESDSYMVIESRKILSNAEDGNKLTLKGKSFETFLSRRIIWGQLNVKDTLQKSIKIIIDSSIINPTDVNRKIQNFIFAENEDDIFKNKINQVLATRSALNSVSKTNLTKYDIFEITTDETKNGITSYYRLENNEWLYLGTKKPAMMVDAQYYGETVYDVISELCQDNKIGFKVVAMLYKIVKQFNSYSEMIENGTNYAKGECVKVTIDETRNNQMSYYRYRDTGWLYIGNTAPDQDTQYLEFSLINGVNRTNEQTERSPIIFSRQYDNLIESDLDSDKTFLKNITLIAGEGEGTDRMQQTVAVGNKITSGLSRREVFTDASSISKTVDDRTLTDAEYAKKLQNEGNSKLIENRIKYNFNSEVVEINIYKYKKDYYLGDIVTMKDIFGNIYSSRIKEYIYSVDTDGYKQYPTFEYEKINNKWEDIYHYTWEALLGMTWDNVMNDINL